jgi:hypothetical protein
MKWRRPAENEMAGYFMRYAALVSEKDPIKVMKALKYKSLNWMTKLSLDQWDYRYADGKWSVKEVWLHIIDTERIFSYRGLRIGRGDQTPLPGFDQDLYVPASQASHRTAASIMEEYEAVRNATIVLYENLPAAALDTMGVASNHGISCRAFAFIIPGHERHHLKGFSENYGIK